MEPIKSNGVTNDQGGDSKPAKKPVKHDSGVADLEKVTDLSEEKEISSQNITGAMSLIEGRRSKENEQKVARQKALAAITIKADDVNLIVNELEIPKAQAELKLREHGGNIVNALIALTD